MTVIFEKGKTKAVSPKITSSLLPRKTFRLHTGIGNFLAGTNVS